MEHRNPVSTLPGNPEPSGFPFSVSRENGMTSKTAAASLISLSRVVVVTGRGLAGLANMSTPFLFFSFKFK